LSDLRIQITDIGEGPVFDRFFAGYDRAFVLPDEKEDRDGFHACLALNHGAARAELERRYGRFREICLVADDADGSPIGGANLIAMPWHGDSGTIVTANLNYLYVDGENRGRGHLRRLVTAISEIVSGMFAETDGVAPALIFLEQNDPFAMSDASYARDTEFTGLDQMDRLRIWARLGAKLVDHPYVQPPLSADHAPDASLIYAVLGADAATLPACLVADHLRRFFGISVLKGAPLDGDPTARAQLATLDAGCAAGATIALLDPAPLLGRVTNRGEARALLGAMPATTRDALAILAVRLADSVPADAGQTP
jgi:GNAT superfamily N-acetyltransferase